MKTFIAHQWQVTVHAAGQGTAFPWKCPKIWAWLSRYHQLVVNLSTHISTTQQNKGNWQGCVSWASIAPLHSRLPAHLEKVIVFQQMWHQCWWWVIHNVPRHRCTSTDLGVTENLELFPITIFCKQSEFRPLYGILIDSIMHLFRTTLLAKYKPCWRFHIIIHHCHLNAKLKVPASQSHYQTPRWHHLRGVAVVVGLGQGEAGETQFRCWFNEKAIFFSISARGGKQSVFGLTPPVNASIGCGWEEHCCVRTIL